MQEGKRSKEKKGGGEMRKGKTGVRKRTHLIPASVPCSVQRCQGHMIACPRAELIPGCFEAYNHGGSASQPGRYSEIVAHVRGTVRAEVPDRDLVDPDMVHGKGSVV